MTDNSNRFRFVRVAEVARALDLSEQTIRARIAAGEIPAVRLGSGRGTVRVPASYLQRLSESADSSTSAA